MADELIIETHGRWQPFEVVAHQEHEVGKTYHITVEGDCLLAVSEGVPTGGIQTNEITYTKDDKNRLWIKTKGDN